MQNMDSDISNKIKKCIKEAKKALQEKDYQAALEHCHSVLNIDASNYNALVFKALALQETCQPKQSVATFERAISLEPQQLLAWKGLCGFYEKNSSPENDKELIKVYKSFEPLLKEDPTKQLDIISKLISLSKLTGDVDECVQAMAVLAEKYLDSKDERAEFCAWNSLINYILSTNATGNYYDLLEKAFQRALDTSNGARISESDLQTLQNQHLVYLKLKGSISLALEQAKSYLSGNDNDSQWLEYICHAFCEFCFVSNYKHTFDLTEITEMALLLESLNSKNANSLSLSYTTQATVAYCKNNYLEALKLVAKGLSESTKLIESWVLMSEVHLYLHNYKDSETSCQTGLQHLKSNNDNSVLNLQYFTIFLANLSKAQTMLNLLSEAKQSIARAVKKLDSITEHRKEIEGKLKECEACLALRLNNLKEATEISNELEKSTPHLAYLIKAQVNLLNEDYEEAENLATLSLEFKTTSDGLHILAVSQWNLELNRSEAIDTFLKACKADPYYGRNYLYLGHYYKIQSNLSLSQQCYEKAYELDPYDEKIALHLSDFLMEIQEFDTDKSYHLTVLQKISEHMPRSHWIWFRLGLCYLTDNLTLAIQAFQNAVRLKPNDSKSWECLGDAYLLQGSYGASLNAFNKLAEQKPDDIYSAYQVARNKQLLELYAEALEDYQNIILKDQSYIPACLGLVECQYSLGKDFYNQSLYGLAKSYSTEAIVFLITKIFPSKRNFVSIYKVAGDLTSLLASLGSNHLPIELPCQLLGLPKKETTYSELDLHTSANWCYGKAVAMNPKLHSLWHDLGVTYYLIYQCQVRNESPNAKRVAGKSLACFKKAIELKPNDPSHWMAMGVISANMKEKNNSVFAKRCFMKTLQLESKNVSAYSNLGILYLTCQDINLANEAFSRAQSVDPAHEVPWIGQALVAEKIEHPMKTELFRHSTVLKPRAEGVLGYAHWLISSMVDNSREDLEKSGKKIDIAYKDRWITQAADGLVKLIESDNMKIEAFHYLALLYERQKLYNPAVEAAKKSYKLLKETNASVEVMDASRANLGRLLRLAGHKEESLSILTEIKYPDVSVYCETALTFLETGSPLKAFAAYKMGLNASATSCPSLQADILTAMAFVIRKVPGSEDQAKTFLFKGATCKPQSIPGLLALCTLGFLNSDAVLVNAALSELELYKYDQKYFPRIAHLLALNKAVQGDLKGAIRQICKAIHWQPHSSELWSYLSSFLLLKKSTERAVNSARKAWMHSIENRNSLSQTLLMANCYLAASDVKSSRSLALRAVHCEPDNVRSWCCLLAATNAIPSKNDNLEPIYKSIHKLSASCIEIPLNTSNMILKDWLEAMETYYQLYNYTDISQETVSVQAKGQDLNSSPNKHIVKHLTQALHKQNKSGAASYITNMLRNDSSLLSETLIWSTLIKTRLNEAQYSEAQNEISLWLQILDNSEQSEEDKILPLLYLSLLAKEASHVMKNEADSWISLGKDAIVEALKISNNCHLSNFIFALLSLQKKDKESLKSAEKSLEKLLFSSKDEKPCLNYTKAGRKLLLDIYKSTNKSVAAFEKLLLNAQTHGDDEISRELIKIVEEKKPK